MLHLLAPCVDDAVTMEEKERNRNRMRKSPHCFELAAARGQLDKLNMTVEYADYEAGNTNVSNNDSSDESGDE